MNTKRQNREMEEYRSLLETKKMLCTVEKKGK